MIHSTLEHIIISELSFTSIVDTVSKETNIFLYAGLIALILALAIYTIGYSLTNNHRTDLNKISAYECGYSPNSHESIQYNANFIIICLLFLLIDLEILFLVPFLYIIDHINYNIWKIFLYFTSALMIGVIFELITGSFNKISQIVKTSGQVKAQNLHKNQKNV